MIRRLVRPADFQRLLTAPLRSRSTHFALHHLASAPLPARARLPAPVQLPGPHSLIPALATDLSTGPVDVVTPPVDSSPQDHWLGYVVPKRHAKRAVSRSLLKRQIRSVFALHQPELPPGMWLVRLRAPFATADFISAHSRALAEAARLELGSLLTRVQAMPAKVAPAA